MTRPISRTRACTVASLLIAAVLALATFALPFPAGSQDLPVVTPDDYGRWENPGGAVLSPHGDWIAYTVTRVDEDSELRVRKLDEDSTRVFPWGSSPSFSPDGRWLAWTVGLSPDERERLAESDEPVRQKSSVMDPEHRRGAGVRRGLRAGLRRHGTVHRAPRVRARRARGQGCRRPRRDAVDGRRDRLWQRRRDGLESVASSTGAGHRHRHRCGQRGPAVRRSHRHAPPRRRFGLELSEPPVA